VVEEVPGREVAEARIHPASRSSRVRHRFIDAVAWWRRMPLLWRLLPAFAYGAAIGIGLSWFGF